MSRPPVYDRMGANWLEPDRLQVRVLLVGLTLASLLMSVASPTRSTGARAANQSRPTSAEVARSRWEASCASRFRTTGASSKIDLGAAVNVRVAFGR
jgi:hypothetical protein